MLGWLPADMLTAVLGSGDENKMPIRAAGKVQGRGFEVTETHSSLGLSEQGVHGTRDKLTCIQTPAGPLGLVNLGKGNSYSEPQFLALQNG